MTARTYRIGQIVPSSNTTMETEIPAMLRARESIEPERFTFHSSRMRMKKVTKEELAEMEKLNPRGPDDAPALTKPAEGKAPAKPLPPRVETGTDEFK